MAHNEEDPQHPDVEPNVSESTADPACASEEPVGLLDKALAFGLLVMPFAYGLDRIQDLLSGYPRQINSLVLVAGILGFLISVGFLARGLRDLRKKLR